MSSVVETSPTPLSCRAYPSPLCHLERSREISPCASLSRDDKKALSRDVILLRPWQGMRNRPPHQRRARPSWSYSPESDASSLWVSWLDRYLRIARSHHVAASCQRCQQSYPGMYRYSDAKHRHPLPDPDSRGDRYLSHRSSYTQVPVPATSPATSL